MSIPGAGNPLLLGGAGGYKIERSLRFNSADSAYCGRTFSTPTTQGTFTFSVWVKRGALGGTQQLLGVSTNHSFGFTSGDALNLTFGGTSAATTTAVFRDPGAWYHIVWTQSGTSHTLYVNNVSVATVTATSSVFNTAVAHQIGAANSTNYLNGYLADVHFIDGQALTPSSFGETDINGIWQPKAYAGTYGTNGFKLAFADNSAATATTLGKDTSGNGNNWTPNNLSVTAGAGNDSLVDSPTNYGIDTGAGGEVRGNYATLNPLVNGTFTLANGNLDANITADSHKVLSSIAVTTTGKWYAEITIGTRTGTYQFVGVAQTSNAWGSYFLLYRSDGIRWADNGAQTSGWASYATGDVIGVAYDSSTKTATFYKNGATVGSLTSTIPSGEMYFAAAGSNAGSHNYTFNFGQRPFAYTAPSGFKALCTQNLPAPTITKPSTVMDVALWTGNGSARSITGLGFNPDLVWIKGRSGATDHALYDSVRGVEKRLESNNTDAEVTSDGGVTAFNSDGFSLGTLAQVNTNTATYAGWTWDAGSSTVTNTDGTITSQVRANASAGFSIVTYTGGTTNSTVGHGLGVTPEFIVCKSRNNATGWPVYHKSLGRTSYVSLNLTDASASYTNYWGVAGPNSTTFGVSDATYANNNGNMVAYCFAPVAGYSAFGFYTGNGSADGPMVFTNMRPRWIMIKAFSAGSTEPWNIIDTTRNPFNVATAYVDANSSAAEGTYAGWDILSNGFKLRNTGSSLNANGASYLYAAFADAPFALARAR